ncbi:hypothetical protein PCANC_26895 [Puccinia coronata f. sp. avenae]|uniref:Uncharacterized protein n=1 Tax=Puccinia coronata f. sp. avenae TaxID=200324 RepID=A0A2N5S376_9BASI|nr:hypothetical protein PCANC_26895 [Puccinia coronata f. sp. avenae]
MSAPWTGTGISDLKKAISSSPISCLPPLPPSPNLNKELGMDLIAGILDNQSPEDIQLVKEQAPHYTMEGKLSWSFFYLSLAWFEMSQRTTASQPPVDQQPFLEGALQANAPSNSPHPAPAIKRVSNCSKLFHQKPSLSLSSSSNS